MSSRKLSKVLNKYKYLKDYEFFYKNGFLKFEFKNNYHFENLKERCKNSITFPNNGWEWIGKEKYKEDGIYTSLDLRNSNEKIKTTCTNFIYEKKDIEFLFESGIYRSISRITGRDLVLVCIKYRIAFNGRSGKNIRGLHRDSHMYKNTPKYFYPAPINLHIYPCFGNSPSSQLKIWNGTNNLQTDIKLIDKLYSSFVKPCELPSSETSIYLIDTASLHQVSSNKENKGDFRIMYSFLNRDCFELKNEDMKQYYDTFLSLEKKYI